MKKDTRIAYNSLLGQIAKLSGVPSAKEQFAVEPSVQQTLESKIQESSEFMTRINIQGVDELKGQKLGLGVTGPIAKRTDVTAKDRATSDVSSLEAHDYECASTEFDTHLTWAKLDAWAQFPDFQTRVRNAIIRQQALDRIMIAFNGTSAAVESDPVANPLLQDVNIGWLQHYRDHAPARVLSEVVAASGQVTYGEAGDYKNIDALVYDAVGAMIDEWHRESTDLVAIMGRQLMDDKYFPMISQHAQTPSENRALDMLVSQQRVGGLQAVQAPFVPSGTIFITSLSNLSMYWQRGSRRRYMQENPKRNRVENYESSNDAYVVEDYGFGCLIENITAV